MADVFVSYKSEERARAEDVVNKLKALGFSVWWDNHLTPRNGWDAEIEFELSVAKAVVVLWSRKAAAIQELNSGQRVGSFVRREALYALDKGKYIPCKIETCELPLAFIDRQTADISDWDGVDDEHEGWSKLLSWLKPLVPSEQEPSEGRSEIVSATINLDPSLLQVGCKVTLKPDAIVECDDGSTLIPVDEGVGVIKAIQRRYSFNGAISGAELIVRFYRQDWYELYSDRRHTRKSFKASVSLDDILQVYRLSRVSADNSLET